MELVFGEHNFAPRVQDSEAISERRLFSSGLCNESAETDSDAQLSVLLHNMIIALVGRCDYKLVMTLNI